MSIEADLKKDGISIIRPLDQSSVISLVQNISKKLYLAFPNFGNYEFFFENLSKVSMYIADIPNGMSEASYYYKNDSIYFKDGIGFSDLEKYSMHEFIHHVQARKDKKDNPIRLGLCEFKGSKITGMALNEAAVQIMSANALDYTFETVEYYGITFSTISPTAYPLLCNIVTQMAYVTGEDILFDSTFNSNDHFKNKFIALCGSKTFNAISKNLDDILYAEETIIKLNNILENKDLHEAKSYKLSQKIEQLKSNIQQLYFKSQELIITSYFNTLYLSLFTTVDIENFRKNLYSFQELIGNSSNYYFFNDFYINMMEKLDNRFDVITGSTYLVPKKESKFMQCLNFIKKLIIKREFEYKKVDK